MVPILVVAMVAFAAGVVVGFGLRSHRLDETLQGLRSELSSVTELLALERLRTREAPDRAEATMSWLASLPDPPIARPGRAATRGDR